MIVDACVLVILIFFNLGRPIFFRQLRPGLNSKPFLLIKFRSMKNAIDSFGNLLPDDQRITTLCNFIRKSSLDELPELWNVLKGDMSLVGPRPLLMEYLPLYTPEQLLRHNVRPGITGWAQVSGRNNISWEQKFKYDLWYIENQSLALDIKIIFMTIKRVFTREGINSKDHATCSPFKGDKFDD